MIAVHIDLEGEYKVVCAALALDKTPKRLVKLNEKEIPKDATAYWGGSASVKSKYKAKGIPEWKPEITDSFFDTEVDEQILKDTESK